MRGEAVLGPWGRQRDIPERRVRYGAGAGGGERGAGGGGVPLPTLYFPSFLAGSRVAHSPSGRIGALPGTGAAGGVLTGRGGLGPGRSSRPPARKSCRAPLTPAPGAPCGCSPAFPGFGAGLGWRRPRPGPSRGASAGRSSAASGVSRLFLPSPRTSLGLEVTL